MAKAPKEVVQAAAEAAPAIRCCKNCKFSLDHGGTRLSCSIILPMHIVRSQDRRLYETPPTYVCDFHKYK